MSKAARDNEGSERAGESQHYNNGVNSALREIDVLEAVWVFFGVRGHAASSAEVDSSPVQSWCNASSEGSRNRGEHDHWPEKNKD